MSETKLKAAFKFRIRWSTEVDQWMLEVEKDIYRPPIEGHLVKEEPDWKWWQIALGKRASWRSPSPGAYFEKIARADSVEELRTVAKNYAGDTVEAIKRALAAEARAAAHSEVHNFTVEIDVNV